MRQKRSRDSSQSADFEDQNGASDKTEVSDFIIKTVHEMIRLAEKHDLRKAMRACRAALALIEPHDKKDTTTPEAVTRRNKASKMH